MIKHFQKLEAMEGEKSNPAHEKPAEVEAAQDEVVITAEKHNPPPSTYTVLTKTIDEGKPPLREELADGSCLETYDDTSVASLHQKYMMQVVQNRETENSVVTLMKKKYEVHSLHISIYV